jgi:hypothetical protein
MSIIYCKTVGANEVGFYLQAAGKEYFLCRQRYYGSLWNYFAGGVDIHALFSKSGKHSYIVREVKMKLPAYIQYVEREEGIHVLDKSLQKADLHIGLKKRHQSKNASYNWRNDSLAKIA